MLQHTIDKWLSPHGGLLLNKGITNEVAAPPHSPEINDEVHPAEHSSESPDSRLTSPAECSAGWTSRSEEHTSELQSHSDLVCRLLLEKKKDKIITCFVT